MQIRITIFKILLSNPTINNPLVLCNVQLPYENSNIPFQPSFLAISPTELPFSWLSLDTMVSAGCDTMAQNTPAMYPAVNVTANCSDLLQSARGLGTTCLYRTSTVRSKQENFIMVYGICLPHNGTIPL